MPESTDDITPGNTDVNEQTDQRNNAPEDSDTSESNANAVGEGARPRIIIQRNWIRNANFLTRQGFWAALGRALCEPLGRRIDNSWNGFMLFQEIAGCTGMLICTRLSECPFQEYFARFGITSATSDISATSDLGAILNAIRVPQGTRLETLLRWVNRQEGLFFNFAREYGRHYGALIGRNLGDEVDGRLIGDLIGILFGTTIARGLQSLEVVPGEPGPVPGGGAEPGHVQSSGAVGGAGAALGEGAGVVVLCSGCLLRGIGALIVYVWSERYNYG